MFSYVCLYVWKYSIDWFCDDGWVSWDEIVGLLRVDRLVSTLYFLEHCCVPIVFYREPVNIIVYVLVIVCARVFMCARVWLCAYVWLCVRSCDYVFARVIMCGRLWLCAYMRSCVSARVIVCVHAIQCVRVGDKVSAGVYACVYSRMCDKCVRARVFVRAFVIMFFNVQYTRFFFNFISDA